MARAKNTDVEVEDVATEETATPAKVKAAPKRGDLPEGYVTPVGLAKLLTEQELHTDKNGGHEVKPQMVYSYIKNASKEDPFPIETIQDSIGADRQVVKTEEGLAWWERKNTRAQARRDNAAAKATAKEEKAAAKAVEAENAGTEAE